MIKVTLKDGNVMEVSKGTSVFDVAKQISEGLARVATCGEVNGEIKDLRYELNEDCTLNICTFNSSLEGKKAYWHTTSHIMAQAIKRLFPDVKLAIGPAIDAGFYYDFDVKNPFTDEDKLKIEQEMKPDIIDINMGCPVPKIAIRSQAGASLLKNPAKIYEIVAAVVQAVNIPVTVKIRSGWDSSSINAVEVAKQIERAGAKAITIHARTRAQGYAGKADWSIIKKVKESVSIPVIGNGDVTSCYLAKKMLEETGCDAVMIGRGVLGNPWLIKECVEYLDSGIEPRPISPKEKINMLKRHFDLLVQDKNEKQAILEIRTHALWYIKGLKGSAAIKNQICQTKTKEEMFSILDNYLNNLDI